MALKHERTVRLAASLLHSFSQDEIERRQYERVDLRFPLWWLKDFKGNDVVPGIGIEISGGGLQFLLEHKVDQCSLAFLINDRRMRANILVVQSADCTYEGRQWYRHRAKFVGLMSNDFDYITAFTDACAQRPLKAAASHAQRSEIGRASCRERV